MKYKANAIQVVVVLATDTPTGLYDASGAIRLCISDGSKTVGAYAPNGALWVTPDPTTLHPIYAPDGSIYASSGGPVGFYMPDGTMNITS